VRAFVNGSLNSGLFCQFICCSPFATTVYYFTKSVHDTSKVNIFFGKTNDFYFIDSEK